MTSLRPPFICGRALGLSLAKGFVRGLTRRPNPLTTILVCCPFLDVCEGVRAVPIC